MPLFICRAKKGPGDVIEKSIEADTPDQAIAQLTGEGYYPLSVKPASQSKAATAAPGSLFSRIRVKDINIFTRQLASLIKSGVPLLKAINIIIDQTENQSFRTVLEDISRQIKEGQQLSFAMSHYPKIFPRLYTAMVKTGEDSGTLEQILIRLTDHREKQEEIRSKIRTSLAYPLLTLAVGLATIVILVVAVIPQFKQVFDSMGQELPLPTKILISFSDFMTHQWYIILGLVVLLLIVTKGVTIIEKTALDAFKLHLPVLGRFIQKSELNKFTRTLGLLLTNGIPILSALDITIPTISNDVIKKELKRIAEGLKSGNSLAQGLKETPYFPPYLVNMVAVGEESGRLEETLTEIAATYEREIEESTKIFLSLLEPCLILGLGLVVGFILMSILLPMVQMLDIAA